MDLIQRIEHSSHSSQNSRSRSRSNSLTKRSAKVVVFNASKSHRSVSSPQKTVSADSVQEVEDTYQSSQNQIIQEVTQRTHRTLRASSKQANPIQMASVGS